MLTARCSKVTLRIYRSGIPKTDIIQDNLENYRNFNHDHLGRPKNLGQTGQLYDKDLIFGKNPRKQDIWNVAQCIRGDASFKEAYEDPNLGKSTRYGFRNRPLNGDEGRAFGVPSIRFDVTKPQNTSLANTIVNSSHKNFGNDPCAIELLFPHCYGHYGLTEDDIKMPRIKEEVPAELT